MNCRWLRATLAAALAVGGFFAAAAVLAPRPRLIWNASPSVPVGLYRIDVDASPRGGELVAILPPERLGRWLAARGYLPHGLPLLKHVAAEEGALVCRSGTFVTIDGAFAARSRDADRLGRPLPRWLGCRRIASGEFFLLGAAPDSLDSRYFGPIPASGLIGIAHPLIADAAAAPPSPVQSKETSE